MMNDRVRSLAAPLRAQRLRRLTGAFLVSELGDGVSTVVLPLLVYDSTRSAGLTGATFGAMYSVGLVGRPVGGLLADRLDRVRVLRTTYVVRALLLTVGLAARNDGVLATCLLLTAFVGTVDNPSGEAAMRENARDIAQQVATIRKVSRAMSGIVGLALGGLLVGAIGHEWATAADVGTYVAAIALLPRSRRPTTSRAWKLSGAHVDRWRASTRRLRVTAVGDARDGLTHVCGQAELRLVAATSILAAALVTAVLAAAVVRLDDLAAAPDGAYGLALASYSAGFMTGLTIAGTIRWRLPLAPLTRRCLLAAGTACALGGWSDDWRLLCLSWVAWGLSWAPFEIRSDTRLVQLSPERLLGRTYGGIGLLVTTGRITGAVLGGTAVNHLDAGRAIVACGLLYCGASLALAPRTQHPGGASRATGGR
jgi:MFS family permease